jgi:hypothetical protein
METVIADGMAVSSGVVGPSPVFVPQPLSMRREKQARIKISIIFFGFIKSSNL